MKIYSWNVNGIRAVERKKLWRDFIDKHQPDVICIQETKTQPSQVASEMVEKYPQYHQYWYSANKKGYSGTAIFTKIRPKRIIKGLPGDLVEKYNLEDRYGNLVDEGRVLTIELDDFFITTVYTPNAKDDLSRISVRQEWDSMFLEFMKRLEKTKPLIICGDFNVAHMELDLARPKPNIGKKGFTPEERSGFDKFVKNGFIDVIREFNPGVSGLYTWWSHWGKSRERNVGWRIDYFLVSSEVFPRIQSAAIHQDIFGSDHCPVSIVLR